MDRRRSRNAHHLLRRHPVGPDGRCLWCGGGAARSRLDPGPAWSSRRDDALAAHDELTRPLPVPTPGSHGRPARNERRLR